MPRKTPVKELLSEEVTPGSPLRRSNRLSSPAPSRVLTRRTSATEASAAATPKQTQSRRYSTDDAVAPIKEESEKKKPIRGKKLSPVPPEDTEDDAKKKPKTRAALVAEEEVKTPVKRGRKGSVTKEDKKDNAEEAPKRALRSRGGSVAKTSSEEEKPATTRKRRSSLTSEESTSRSVTPIKKTSPKENVEALDPIEEDTNEKSAEENHTVTTRKRKTDVPKLDLSVINESSFVEDLETKSSQTAEESFILQLSPSPEEEAVSDPSEGNTSHNSNKENISPKKPELVVNVFSEKLSMSMINKLESEPMDVDQSLLDVTVNLSTAANPQVVMTPLDKKLEMAEKINNEIADFLAEDVASASRKTSPRKQESPVRRSLRRSVGTSESSDNDTAPKKDNKKEESPKRSTRRSGVESDLEKVAKTSEENAKSAKSTSIENSESPRKHLESPVRRSLRRSGGTSENSDNDTAPKKDKDNKKESPKRSTRRSGVELDLEKEANLISDSKTSASKESEENAKSTKSTRSEISKENSDNEIDIASLNKSPKIEEKKSLRSEITIENSDNQAEDPEKASLKKCPKIEERKSLSKSPKRSPRISENCKEKVAPEKSPKVEERKSMDKKDLNVEKQQIQSPRSLEENVDEISTSNVDETLATEDLGDVLISEVLDSGNTSELEVPEKEQKSSEKLKEETFDLSISSKTETPEKSKRESPVTEQEIRKSPRKTPNKFRFQDEMTKSLDTSLNEDANTSSKDTESSENETPSKSPKTKSKKSPEKSKSNQTDSSDEDAALNVEEDAHKVTITDSFRFKDSPAKDDDSLASDRLAISETPDISTDRNDSNASNLRSPVKSLKKPTTPEENSDAELESLVVDEIFSSADAQMDSPNPSEAKNSSISSDVIKQIRKDLVAEMKAKLAEKKSNLDQESSDEEEKHREDNNSSDSEKNSESKEKRKSALKENMDSKDKQRKSENSNEEINEDESQSKKVLLKSDAVSKEIDEKLNKLISGTMDEKNKSPENVDDSIEDEDEKSRNEFLDDMAEEGDEDTPSEGSNDIIEVGEEINTTDSEMSSDGEDCENDSFIDDDEKAELLSGTGDDLSFEQKKSRIIKLDDHNSDEDVIRIEKPEKKKVLKPKKSRIIRPTDSSDEEIETIEIDDTEASKIVAESPNVSKKIIIHENISVSEIESEELANQIQQAVNSLCDTMKSPGRKLSLNLSVDYTENPETEKKAESPKKSVSVEAGPSGIKRKLDETASDLAVQSKAKKRKLRKKKNKKKVLSTSSSQGETTTEVVEKPKKKKKKRNKKAIQDEVPMKLSTPDKFGKQEKIKTPRPSTSNIKTPVNVVKDKKRKIVEDVVENQEIPVKRRKKHNRKSKDGENSFAKSILEEVVVETRKKNKVPRMKPSLALATEPWTESVRNIKPSFTDFIKEIKPSTKVTDPKDFRNNAINDPKRVRRVETAKLLKKRGAFI